MTALVILDSITLATPDGRPLFDGLSLAIGRERTGIVGRNGCGKSTLLRLIGGEIEPVAGSVRRAGSIGMLAQLADDRLTVAQALGVSESASPACAGSNAARARWMTPLTPTGRWKAVSAKRWLRSASPPCRSTVRSRRSVAASERVQHWPAC